MKGRDSPRFGLGVNRVADIKAARPGSRECLASYRAIAQRRMILESARPSNDASQLTGKELEQELLRLVAKAAEE
jgi:hypothetical protein